MTNQLVIVTHKDGTVTLERFLRDTEFSRADIVAALNKLFPHWVSYDRVSEPTDTVIPSVYLIWANGIVTTHKEFKNDAEAFAYAHGATDDDSAHVTKDGKQWDSVEQRWY